ncbi:MAG: YbaB/EbfC family nucleoid-associated protein [Cyclobacteriaceae bacterium]|nr:YbaB/EbfC family nucleoid-associated protein [Cyclobacteriaceae bacterium]
MLDMMKMMGKAKEVQEKMKKAQESLGELIIEAESGAGMVTARVNGKKELLDLKIDDSLIDPKDAEMLKDLIVAAVNKAMSEADQKAREHIQKVTQEFLPNIPGFDLSGLV